MFWNISKENKQFGFLHNEYEVVCQSDSECDRDDVGQYDSINIIVKLKC